MTSRQKIVQQRYLNNEKLIIRRLNAVYTKAHQDITDGIASKYKKIDAINQQLALMDKDDPKRYILESRRQALVYQKNYQEALNKQISGILDKTLKNDYDTVNAYLNECYDEGFLGTLYSIQGQGVPLTLPINQQRMVHAVQLESKISTDLYTKLGENVDLLKRKIMAQTSYMMAAGISYQKCAERLAAYTTIGMNKSIRIARTEGHRIQCTAAFDCMTDAKEAGADVVKQWDSTLDGRTRPTHRIVDGEWVELEEEFSNGLMFPGDPNGAPAEVINCRCALLERARWALDNGFTKRDYFSENLREFSSPADYEDFKKWYNHPDNVAYMKYVQALEDKYYTKNFYKLLDSMTDREYDTFKKLEASRPVENWKNKNVASQATQTTVIDDTIRNTTTKLAAAMDGVSYDEYMYIVDNNELIKPLYRHADELRGVNYKPSGGCYSPAGNYIDFSYPAREYIATGMSKFDTIAHEYGHFFDRLSTTVKITHNEYGGIMNIINMTPQKRLSNSDQFLAALRKDTLTVKNNLMAIRDYCIVNMNTTAGVQDALDGLSFGRIAWGHGDKYYNRFYTTRVKGAIFDYSRDVKAFYKSLGFDASNQTKVKRITRDYETASELWANITSALTVGSKEVELFEKYFPETLEMYKKLVRGIK